MLVDATKTGKTTEQILQDAREKHKVLLKKIDPIPAKPYVELVAERIGGEVKRYL